MTDDERETDLWQRFGSYCLDDEYERLVIAAYINRCVAEGNGTRPATDEAHELVCIIRVNDPDGSPIRAQTIERLLREKYSERVTVEALPRRPFKKEY